MIPVWVLGLGRHLLNPRVLLALGAGFFSLWLGWKVWSFVDAKHDAEVRVAHLEQVVSAKEAEIETLTFMRQQSARAAAAANAANIESEHQSAKHRVLRDEALSAKGEADGPVAPVLRRALDGLGELRTP